MLTPDGRIMNRRERRKLDAALAKGEHPFARPELERPDGRPEAYDVGDGDFHACRACAEAGHPAKFERGKIVIMPGHRFTDGEARLLCIEQHCPDDVVIFDPRTGQCRDKTGQNVWTEK